MKRNQFKPVALVAIAAILLSGCSGLNKMKKNAGQINFKVTPEILETHAGEVGVAITGRFPQAYFNKRVTLTATPVLEYEGGKTSFKSVTVQGENVEANNKVISYNGGSFSYKDAVAFKKAMAKSELKVNITASQGTKSVDFDPIKIADGVLATSERVVMAPKAVLGVVREKNNSGKYNPNTDVFQRIVPDEKTADIHYLINRAKVRKSEVESADVTAFEDYTQKANENERVNLKDVKISAYASPDGELERNFKLAEQRKETSTAFLAKKLKKAGVDVELKTRYTPEDWDGFKTLMEKSNIQDKDLILRVLSMYNDPEVREREIRNLSTAFNEIAEEILPQLRRAKLTVDVDLIGKTDEELKAAAKSNPASLNPAELLYAATLFEDLGDQLDVYKAFTQNYPNDWRGPNNVGYVLVKQMKYAKAKPYFVQAEKLNNASPIVKNNLGAVTISEGNTADAESLLGAATGAGNEVNYNLGIVCLKKAEYDKAVRCFKLSQYRDANTGLAKLLTDDNNGALSDLDAFAKDCYMKEYLKAVVGARTNNSSLVYESLAKAIKLNPEMKDAAKVDLEFAKYFSDAKFQAILD